MQLKSGQNLEELSDYEDDGEVPFLKLHFPTLEELETTQ